MSSLLLILLSAVLVCHYASSVPALQPFVASDPFESAAGIALAAFITLVVVSPLSYVVDHGLLASNGLSHLRVLILVILIIAIVRITALLLTRSGRWLPIKYAFELLLTTHCAVLGAALLSTLRVSSFTDALLFGAGTGLAFATMLLMFTAMQQRLRHAAVPVIFREAPAALITVGLVAVAFMGFTGLITE